MFRNYGPVRTYKQLYVSSYMPLGTLPAKDFHFPFLQPDGYPNIRTTVLNCQSRTPSFPKMWPRMIRIERRCYRTQDQELHTTTKSVSVLFEVCVQQDKPTVKPKAPIRFQNPICHPRTPNAGIYHFGWVSNINRILLRRSPWSAFSTTLTETGPLTQK